MGRYAVEHAFEVANTGSNPAGAQFHVPVGQDVIGRASGPVRPQPRGGLSARDLAPQRVGGGPDAGDETASRARVHAAPFGGQPVVGNEDRAREIEQGTGGVPGATAGHETGA